jgi:holo-[acyl-carrier protein] synthase
VARVEREASRPGLDLLDELFTPAERAAAASAHRPGRRYAAGYAVKEACFKALGTGKVGRMAWRDIEVTAPRGGALSVALSGETARVALEHGVGRVLATVSVTRDCAVAWVVAVGAGG